MNLGKFLKIVLVLTLTMSLIGCEDDVVDNEGNKITGKVTANLQNNVIQNGETTIFTMDGQNTANIARDVFLRITPEDSEMVKVSYDGNLNERVGPGETMGVKNVKVQGFTKHTKTTYKIKVELVDKETNGILDEKIYELTVRK